MGGQLFLFIYTRIYYSALAACETILQHSDFLDFRLYKYI